MIKEKKEKRIVRGVLLLNCDMQSLTADSGGGADFSLLSGNYGLE